MYKNIKFNSGFTLLELIVTIAIAGILLAMAIPSFSDMIRNSRLTTYSNELVTALNYARSEAVKREQNVVVRKTGTNWETGWQVFVDLDRTTSAKENVFNDDGDSVLCEAGEDCVLRSYASLPSPFTLRGSNNFANFVRYQPDGTSSSFGSLALCYKPIKDSNDNGVPDNPDANASRLIIIRNLGRIRIGKDSNGNGIPEFDSKTDLNSCSAPSS